VYSNSVPVPAPAPGADVTACFIGGSRAGAHRAGTVATDHCDM